jgi:hypothetical protein
MALSIVYAYRFGWLAGNSSAISVSPGTFDGSQLNIVTAEVYTTPLQDFTWPCGVNEGDFIPSIRKLHAFGAVLKHYEVNTLSLRAHGNPYGEVVRV